ACASSPVACSSRPSTTSDAQSVAFLYSSLSASTVRYRRYISSSFASAEASCGLRARIALYRAITALSKGSRVTPQSPAGWAGAGLALARISRTRRRLMDLPKSWLALGANASEDRTEVTAAGLDAKVSNHLRLGPGHREETYAQTGRDPIFLAVADP